MNNIHSIHTRQLRRSLSALAALLSIPLGTCALASDLFKSERDIDQYGHKVWTSQNGVPGEAVYQILQTSDGYLWMRTSAGLARFDGTRFVRIDPSVDGVPLREAVRAINKTPEGDLLVQSVSKTVVYRGGHFENLRPPANLPDGTIRIILESRDKNLWIGSDDFIYLSGPGGWRMLKRGTSWIESLVEAHDSSVWIGGERELFRYKETALNPKRPSLAA